MPSATVAVAPARFFGLTFILSWSIWIPVMLLRLGVFQVAMTQGTATAIALLGVLMPAVSALVLTGGSGGRTALRTLLKRLTIWRVGWSWWGVALLLQPVLLVATALVFNRFGGSPRVSPVPQGSVVTLCVNVVFMVLASMGEEIGWRGLALPALQLRVDARTASIILGLLGATWHLPYWTLLGTLQQYGIGYFVMNYLFVVALTFQITWFYNHAQSSALLVVVFHVAFNLVNVVLLPVTSSVGAFTLLTVLEWMIALVLNGYLSRPAKARGHLGQPVQKGPLA